MRNFSLACLTASLLLASCTTGARIDVTVPQAPGAMLQVRQLDLNSYKLLDSVRTDAAGRASYSVKLLQGQPEFVYLFYKDTKIASLLLQEGEKAVVSADTLGHYQVSGSPESEALAGVEAAAARFGAAMTAATEPAEIARIFIDHYRESVKYVMTNKGSLTVIPVLFEQVDAINPLFNQYTDAIIFRQAADTLAKLYPESRYVKALEKETVRRENALKLKGLVGSARQLGYPDITLPGIDGQKVSLSEVETKAVLVHFWDSSDAAQKMFNLDVLLPLWNKWHDRGLSIYAIDVNPDKTTWGSVVSAQQLPWTNVNGGRANAQAIALYNVNSVPATFLLAGGTLSTSVLGGSASLDKELARIL